MYNYKYFIFLAGFLLPIFCIGQSIDRFVIGTGGDSSPSSSTHMDWTLGETFVSSIVTRQGIITEGFHQPILEVLQIQEQDLAYDNNIQVFPNPTSSQLFINLNHLSAQEQYYWLFDMKGKIVDKGNLGTGKAQEIDLQWLVPGTYLLKIALNEVLDEPSITHHFQIIKH